MYTLRFYRNKKENRLTFGTEQEAKFFADVYWHFSPELIGPDGKPVLSAGGCCDSEY